MAAQIGLHEGLRRRSTDHPCPVHGSASPSRRDSPPDRVVWTKGATMVSTTTTREPFRELAHRENDGVEIVLFWHQPTNELTVSVLDERSGARFELAVEPHEALD